MEVLGLIVVEQLVCFKEISYFLVATGLAIRGMDQVAAGANR